MYHRRKVLAEDKPPGHEVVKVNNNQVQNPHKYTEKLSILLKIICQVHRLIPPLFQNKHEICH